MAGPSAMGSEKGMPSSMRSAPACGQRFEDGERGVVIGVAGGDEGDKPGAPLPLQLGESAVDASHTGCRRSQFAPRVLALK